MQTKRERQSICRVEPSPRDCDQKQMLEDLQSRINRGTDGGVTAGTNERTHARTPGYHKSAIAAKGRR